MKKLVLLFGCMLLCGPVGFAQEVTPRARVEALFDALTPGEIESAIDTFAKASLIPPEFVDEIQSQTRIFVRPDNKTLGYEFLGEENIGQSIKRLTYVLKTVEKPLLWTFSFYKPQEKWVPLRVILSDEL